MPEKEFCRWLDEATEQEIIKRRHLYLQTLQELKDEGGYRRMPRVYWRDGTPASVACSDSRRTQRKEARRALSSRRQFKASANC